MRYKFNEIAINSVEKRIPTEDDKANYIGLEHLESGSLSVSTWGSAVSLKGEKIVMRKGDVLFGKRNTYLRRASIAPHDGLFSAHGMVLRPKPEVIDPSFFPFFVNSDEFFNSTIRISVGSLSPTVNWKDMKELEFDLPPIEKQRELAELLWAANDLKESYKKLITASDEMLKAKFREMFGECGVQSAECGVKLGDCLSDIRYGVSLPPEFVENAPVKFIRATNVNRGIIDEEKMLTITEETASKIEKCRLNGRELIIVRSGANAGDSCFVPEQYRGSCAGYDIIIRVDEEKILPEWLGYLLVVPEYFRSQIKPLTNRTAQPHINAEQVKSLPVAFRNYALRTHHSALPPLATQQEFVEIARKADETKAALKKSIADVETVIKGLINGGRVFNI